MNWQTAMNQAMDYIEQHLTDEIDINKMAQFLNCSEWEFRRLFSLLTQVPLSDYIRRRKLTLAAHDIQTGDKIINVSERYGYKSHAAFSRAFSKFHGISPSSARNKDALFKAYSPLDFKLVLIEGNRDNAYPNGRTNIIGASEVGYAISHELDKQHIHKTNNLFWSYKGRDLLGETSLPYYGAYVTEKKCQLFSDLKNKKVLEIGCGSGQSLLYMAKRQVKELWGLDISSDQIEKAQKLLTENNFSAQFICGPMEDAPGLPKGYFDYIYSIYGIGWTTDLEGTFKRVVSSLKSGGHFIFSWSHPIHKCVSREDDMLIFKKNYFDESWYSVTVGDGILSLSDRKLSTYINALAKAGFIIEEMIEESDEDILKAKENNFSKKAGMLPVTFVIKAQKR